VTLAEAMAAWGRDPERHGEARRIDAVGHYLELHVEQGPRLEASGTDVGVVTSIVGLVGYRVRVSGRTNHAGTTPMSLRRDALAGAARMVLAVRDEARRREDATANVGVITVAPGSSNVIPGRCELTIDLRAPSARAVRELDEGCVAALEAIAADEGLGLELEETYRVAPAPMAGELVEAIERAAGLEGASAARMPSGAGHDAMVLAPHVPAAMLFVPSRGGVSHSPAELTTDGHCELGARVLAAALRELLEAD
jgi:hydantoinase/carbamoylase family amidase